MFHDLGQEFIEHGIEMEGPAAELLGGSSKWSSNHQRNMLRRCQRYGVSQLYMIICTMLVVVCM